MYPDHLLLRDNVRAAHQASWAKIAAPGAFWRGADRLAMVAEARAAHDCALCRSRKEALSPFAVAGQHDRVSSLDATLIDMIHCIATDPQRLTRGWFESLLTSGLDQREYVEALSVVASAIIVDTLHASLGLPLPELPAPSAGEPHGGYDPEAVEEGAWLPIMAAGREMADTGMPMVPNIYRAMGLVPDAVDLFFGTFRPHYALKDIPLSLSQSQAEFVASRVSALNECFY